MRGHTILILAAIVLFGAGWSLGVVLPPDPWRTWLIVVSIQCGLIWYSEPLTSLISEGVQAVDIVIRRRWLVFGIDLATSLLLIGYTCCKDGRWVGVATKEQGDMMGATIFVELFVLGFGSLFCESSGPLHRSMELTRSQS